MPAAAATACLVSRAETAASARIERRQNAWEHAWQGCFMDLERALARIPSSFVATPGFAQRALPATEVVADMLAGDTDVLTGLLLIARDAALAPGELGEQARAWRHKVCRAHAEFHADDAAEANA